jgi:hypothetical protein
MGEEDEYVPGEDGNDADLDDFDLNLCTNSIQNRPDTDPAIYKGWTNYCI